MRDKYQPFLSIEVWTQIFTLINLLILYFVVKKFLFEPIKNIIIKRKNEIFNIYKKANETNQAAISLKIQYEKKLEIVDREAVEIINAAKMDAENKAKVIIDQAKVSANQILIEANLKVKKQQKVFMIQLKEQMVKIILSIVSKVIKEDLDDVKYEKLIKNFIEKVKI